jgi:hypothetical protein
MKNILYLFGWNAVVSISISAFISIIWWRLWLYGGFWIPVFFCSSASDGESAYDVIYWRMFLCCFSFIFAFSILVLSSLCLLALHDIKEKTKDYLDKKATMSFHSFHFRYFLFNIERDRELVLARWCIYPWREVSVSK